MRSFSEVEASFVLQRLAAVVREERSHNLEFEVQNIAVQWAQLSIIFCHTSDPSPTSDSILRFRNRRRPAEENYTIDSDFPLREHLLFVNYNTSTEKLIVFGDLSFRAYQHILAEHSHLRLSDVDRDCEALVYDENPWELKFLKKGRKFMNYMTLLDEHPDQAFPELTSDDRQHALMDSYTEIVFGLNGIEKLEAEQLYDRLLGYQFGKKHRNAQFFYGCLLSAMNENYLSEFQHSEVAKISQLFSLFYNTEPKRVAFCQIWCPSIQIVRPNSPDQFYNLPNECSRGLAESDLEKLQIRHTARYPGRPQPGIYFRSCIINAPSLLQDLTLPVRNGIVSFTHHELFHFVETQILKLINNQVGLLRDRFNLHLADRFMIPMLAQRFFHGTFPTQIKQMLLDINPEMKPNFLNGLMEVYSQLLKLKKISILRDVAMPLIGGLNNCCGLQDWFPVWPRKRALGINDENLYEQHPELMSLHQEVMPPTYEDLVDMSKRYWAPCMQKLAAGRVGGHHMVHKERVRMAALVRALGYREEQGLDLWKLLFERTQVYPGPNKFFQSSWGFVIVYDYRRNKTQDIGVSCRALIANRFCPFAGDSRDIEDFTCQTACRAQFHEDNPKFAMPYQQVRSPRDYFFQARAAMQVEFDELEVV